jgi:hypothetical protein
MAKQFIKTQEKPPVQNTVTIIRLPTNHKSAHNLLQLLKSEASFPYRAHWHRCGRLQHVLVTCHDVTPYVTTSPYAAATSTRVRRVSGLIADLVTRLVTGLVTRLVVLPCASLGICPGVGAPGLLAITLLGSGVILLGAGITCKGRAKTSWMKWE